MWISWQQDFLNHLRFEKRYSAHTLLAYEGDLKQFHAYIFAEYEGLDDVLAIRHYHIRSWLASIKEDTDATATTLNRKRSAINSFYRFLMRSGLAEANPARQLHAQKKVERLPVILQPLQAQQLVEDSPFPASFRGITDRLICELLYATGMRRAEIVGLQETDVEWSLQQLRILGKGGKERLVPLSAELLDALRSYIQEKKKIENADRDGLLIVESGAPIYAGYVYRVVTAYMKLITTQTKHSPHVLRHSFATHLLANGANIQAIKDLLGHSSLAATQVYTHNSIEKLKEVHRRTHPRG